MISSRAEARDMCVARLNTENKGKGGQLLCGVLGHLGGHVEIRDWGLQFLEVSIEPPGTSTAMSRYTPY